MDSRIGLDYIVENGEYIGKLAAALDTPNVTVKKQVFELLAALCVYNTEGYSRALDTLEHYKDLKGERYRLNVIVVELDRASQVDYQTALVAFINCLIISTPRLSDRIRMRNEFIGLNLLPVLSNVRRIAATVPDLAVQLDVFDEQRESDDAQSLQGPHGINLNSHLDVFYAILRQVAETPQEIPFLSILQHLLRVDPKEAVSDIIWDTAETLVHRATLLENREDAYRLLRAPSIQTKFGCQHCRNDSICNSSRKQSLGNTGGVVTSPIPPLPPLPPPPPNISPFPSVLPPPPPPPPPIGRAGGAPPCPPAPPPLQKLTVQAPASTPEPPDNSKLLPQQETPVPRSKMKTINWNKIPNNKVVGKNNIWSLVANSHQHSPMADLDWAEMEGLFCQQAPPANTAQCSPRLGRDTGSDTLERKAKKENSEITLLDGKRSLNVNIFLKQFRSTNEDIIQLIKDGEHDDIGAEKLRGLLKILPEVDELDMLKAFDGDQTKLGNAEKFLLQLIQLPNYKLRIESMLLKQEFATNMAYLEPSINAMIYAGDDLMVNKPLQEVLYMVLVAGNFLNSGGYAGNAAGVKLSSLQKLTDIRANKPGMNLIHYVAMQAEKKNKDLLTFPDDMTVLENASKTTVEQLHNELNTLETRIQKVKRQIDLPTTEREIKDQTSKFLQIAEQEVAALQRGMEELETVRKQLSEFFCEDPVNFKLEECFRVFQGFCVKFRQAVHENERRKVQEEQATIRRRQREEQLANKRRQLGGLAGTPTSDTDNNLVDALLYDIRTGFPQKKGRRNGSTIASEDEISLTGSPALTRRRFGSFNSNGPENSAAKDNGVSPDLTPNGSLRRRRSRVLLEEDEDTLMDFLRTSGHDSSRERKSYGSLDRSWARRARSGGNSTKKRPDLLNVDFSGDRERPSSPSPLAESKPLPSEEKPPYVREWRQKIESWLQANEKEDQQNKDLTRRARRLQANRRSLEDSESERSGTLDTLPEGKLAQPVNSSPTYRRVYPEWKPSTAIDKTDVVGTMEAIEEAQPQIKDKSAWRKSTLNVPNSTEETETDIRRLRRQKSRPSTDGSLTSGGLKSIEEEDKRKNIIASLGERPASDRLSLYIRRPNDNIETEHSINEEDQSPPSVPVRLRRNNSPEDTEVNNTIEIDSDNIETPPATRRLFSPTREPCTPTPCRRLQLPKSTRDLMQGSKKEESQKDNENVKENIEVLGDGQFDRFSSARRTRRYKRPTDYGSSNEDHQTPPKRDVVSPELVADKQLIRPSQLQVHSSYPVKMSNVTESSDKESRLKLWQNRLKIQERTPEPEDVLTHSPVSRLARHRNMTGINQEEVMKAIRELKSPMGNNKEPTWPRIVSKTAVKSTTDAAIKSKWASDDKTSYRINTELIPEIKIKGQKLRSEHDLNDEGFEETQSLVSESPSQGTSSGCNYETDAVDSNVSSRPKPARVNSTDSTGTVDTNLSDNSKPTAKTLSRTPIKTRVASGKFQSLIDRNIQSLERSKSMRSPAANLKEDTTRRSVIPRRSNSLRKDDSQSSVISQRRMGVERSNSRTSLRSSRSSLNSSTSVNTVKKVPINKTPIRVLNSKPIIIKSVVNKPFAPVQSKVRVPASRSSSSGSSIGPSVRKPPIRSTITNSFKENINVDIKSNIPDSRSSSSGSSIGPKAAVSRIPSTNRASGFMRPTTASTTKIINGIKTTIRPAPTNVK